MRRGLPTVDGLGCLLPILIHKHASAVRPYGDGTSLFSRERTFSASRTIDAY